MTGIANALYGRAYALLSTVYCFMRYQCKCIQAPRCPIYDRGGRRDPIFRVHFSTLIFGVWDSERDSRRYRSCCTNALCPCISVFILMSSCPCMGDRHQSTYTQAVLAKRRGDPTAKKTLQWEGRSVWRSENPELRRY